MVTIKSFFVTEGSDEEDEVHIAAEKRQAHPDEGLENLRLPAQSGSGLPTISSTYMRANIRPSRQRESSPSGVPSSQRISERFTSGINTGPKPLGESSRNPNRQAREYL
jgi:hypothetical protein